MPRVFSKLEYQWDDTEQRYVLVNAESINWTGPVALCKGASSAQTNLANQQSQFYSQLSQDYGTQFANQSNILSSLNKSLTPTLQAGVNQFGFNPAETNTLNSQAIQGTAQQYANASRALKEGQAAQGGGNSLLPSGANQAQQASLAAAGANNTSNQLLGIQEQGYQQGRQNYNQAVADLGGVASQYNPAGFAGQATGAGNSAFGSQTQVQEMNNAASPWNVVGGILGGAASAGVDALTGGLGGGFAKSLLGGGGGGGAPSNTLAPTGIFAQTY